MSLDIHGIAKKIDKYASHYSIGNLQEIRTRLKGFERRPGSKIFSTHTTFDDWAFHHGGRTELQFNIGYVGGRTEQLRYGIAFSLELSMTLKTIDVLVPKVKFFNDYILLNAEEFSDMRMWHYADDERSKDYLPGPIPPNLVAEGVFIFMGSRQSGKNIDYDKILHDFDRLLPLYEYVESQGKTKPVTMPSDGKFDFKAGCTKKKSSAKATFAEMELDLDLRHNDLQQALYDKLAKKYGKENVGTERPSGVGTKIDVVLRQGKEFWFYEIKTALTARACLREAIGQLLEYSFWPNAKEPTRFVVVGEASLDDEGEKYLRCLQKRFTFPIYYERIVL